MSSAPASSPSSGLYIPVHKRRCSTERTDDSMSTTSSSSSSRPSSRAESRMSSDVESDAEALVYCPDRLLALAKSPLATMPKEVKDGLRERFPEIVMSRKQRKAIEYRTMMQQRAETQDQAQSQNQSQSKSKSQSQGKTTTTTTTTTQAQPEVYARKVELAQPPSITAQRQTYTYYVPRDSPSHSRPVGRAWWSAPKSAPVDGMNWRRAAGFASIPVA